MTVFYYINFSISLIKYTYLTTQFIIN